MADKDKSETQVSRRNLFQIIGSAPMVAAVTAGTGLAQENHAHMHSGDSGSAPKGPYQRKIFDDQQWRTVGVLCDLIIPADEQSGSATQAGVPEFIDDWIDFRKAQDGHFRLEAQILGGLTWLDVESNRTFQKAFADAAPEQQKKLLDRIAYPDKAAKEDHAFVLFFNRFRDLTVSGFFSSKMGVKDLKYMGNVALAEWKGCPPEIWATIEQRMKNGYKGVTLQEVKPWGA
jgi:gluconate 2-dehydrogenase subunit 3-like protein